LNALYVAAKAFAATTGDDRKPDSLAKAFALARPGGRRDRSGILLLRSRPLAMPPPPLALTLVWPASGRAGFGFNRRWRA
jgi:hypothetical protein